MNDRDTASEEPTMSLRMAAALDDAVERMLAVMLKWSTDPRGPSVSWGQGLAETVAMLVSARAALAVKR